MNNIRSIVFLSNNLTYHQVSFSDAMFKLTAGNYTFIETSEKAKERQKIGQKSFGKAYVLVYWENKEVADSLIREADVVISGSAPEWIVQKRVKTGKLLLRYSERPLKKGMEPLRYPDRLLRWNLQNPFWKPIYMLCASAYAASDYRKFGLFKNKTYKWGYFPEVKRYADPEEMIAQKDSTQILWCGRMLDWKHPDDALVVCRMLKEEGYSFQMSFIGSGEMEDKLRQLTREYDLEDCVFFHGFLTPDEVRSHMEKTGIYLFTSDRQEGWGAVLNESMNSGCAVIACSDVGAVPYLLEEGKNGLTYASGDIQMLCDKLKYLIENPNVQKHFGLKAYQTITTIWNAETAAERLIVLSEAILSKKKNAVPYKTGPCSRAD